ncbi:MAG: MBL fold metallo-hydrolase [Pseudomonadota bacterium]
MLLLNRRAVLQAGAAAALVPSLGRAAPASFEVFNGSPIAEYVASTMIVGDESLAVIDAQFTKADAMLLADQIAATGKRLETIFVTHIHPDHMMGLVVLRARFPEARVVAHPAVAELLSQIGKDIFALRQELAGYAATDEWIAPDPLQGPLTLEGESFEVLDPMVGDTALVTPVHLPQFDALVASDVVYSGTPVWVAETITPETIAAWQGSLDRLDAIGASTVIAGHDGEIAYEGTAIDYTRGFLARWEEALANSNDRASLTAAIRDVVGVDPQNFFMRFALNAVYPE